MLGPHNVAHTTCLCGVDDDEMLPANKFSIAQYDTADHSLFVVFWISINFVRKFNLGHFSSFVYVSTQDFRNAVAMKQVELAAARLCGKALLGRLRQFCLLAILSGACCSLAHQDY